MARITRELSHARDQKAHSLLSEKDTEGNFTKTVKQVNDQLKADDGFRMGLTRIYQLFEAARAGKPIPAKDSKARTPEEKAQAKIERKASKAPSGETIAVASV